MQSTISQYGKPAFVGMLDGTSPRSVRSYAAEEIIPVGYPVRLGTNAEKEALKATTGANTIGFALHDHAREQRLHLPPAHLRVPARVRVAEDCEGLGERGGRGGAHVREVGRGEDGSGGKGARAVEDVDGILALCNVPHCLDGELRERRRG